MPDLRDAADPGAVGAAVAALGDGGLVVLPTDTVYGLGGRPDLPAVTARIFEAKRRPRGLALPVLAADAEAASEVGALDDRARALGAAFWPGALTLVVPRGPASRGWDLGDERQTVGVRVPAHPASLAVLRGAGPLAVTSANLSGEDTPGTCQEVRAELGDAADLYLCADPLTGSASTVVDLTGERPRILRTGALAPEDVLAALG